MSGHGSVPWKVSQGFRPGQGWYERQAVALAAGPPSPHYWGPPLSMSLRSPPLHVTEAPPSLRHWCPPPLHVTEAPPTHTHTSLSPPPPPQSLRSLISTSLRSPLSMSLRSPPLHVTEVPPHSTSLRSPISMSLRSPLSTSSRSPLSTSLMQSERRARVHTARHQCHHRSCQNHAEVSSELLHVLKVPPLHVLKVPPLHVLKVPPLHVLKVPPLHIPDVIQRARVHTARHQCRHRSCQNDAEVSSELPQGLQLRISPGVFSPEAFPKTGCCCKASVNSIVLTVVIQGDEDWDVEGQKVKTVLNEDKGHKQINSAVWKCQSWTGSRAVT